MTSAKHPLMIRCGWIAAIWMASLPTAAMAVMPPYFEALAALERIEAAHVLRTDAPELVRLKVKQSELISPPERGCPAKLSWSVDAEVIGVIRGALAPSMVILIRHTWERYDCPGPVQETTPQLSNGDVTDAFLRCTADLLCTPAAGPMSFLSPATFAQEWEKRKSDIQSLQPRQGRRDSAAGSTPD